MPKFVLSNNNKLKKMNSLQRKINENQKRHNIKIVSIFKDGKTVDYATYKK